jgi:hypothetical protein
MKQLKNTKQVTRNGPGGRPMVYEKDMRAAYQVRHRFIVFRLFRCFVLARCGVRAVGVVACLSACRMERRVTRALERKRAPRPA